MYASQFSKSNIYFMCFAFINYQKVVKKCNSRKKCSITGTVPLKPLYFQYYFCFLYNVGYKINLMLLRFIILIAVICYILKYLEKLTLNHYRMYLYTKKLGLKLNF